MLFLAKLGWLFLLSTLVIFVLMPKLLAFWFALAMSILVFGLSTFLFVFIIFVAIFEFSAFLSKFIVAVPGLFRLFIIPFINATGLFFNFFFVSLNQSFN